MLGEILLLRFTGHFDISILGGTNMDIVCGETTASTEGSEVVVLMRFASVSYLATT